MTSFHSIRAGVVGTGFIGVVHVEALRRLGVQVLGVVGSTPERAREKAKTAVLPEPYDSYDAMLADERIDVVHITSPNHLHHAQVRAALEAGKHVVCEKPLALTSAETADLLTLARERGVVHAVNFNIRFYAQCREARERVAAGEIGDVRLVSGSYLQDWLLHESDWNWRLDPQQGGALRAVADIGSHWLDLVQHVTGRRAEAVMADLVTAIPVRKVPVGPVETFAGKGGAAGETVDREMTTEDHAGILVRLEGGARAVLTVSQVSAGRKNACSFEVDGATSALAWNSERPEELWIGHRDRPNELLLRDPALLTPGAARGTVLPGGHAEGFADTFRELYRAVYQAVLAGGPPPEDPGYPTFADGHDEALIGEAIARSADEERWVAIDRTTHTQEVTA